MHPLSRLGRNSLRGGRARHAARRPSGALERLEDRALMATLLGVTTGNSLLRFDSATPATIQSTTPITGLQPGETILGVDFRPADGALFGLGSTSRLYTIDATTGLAAQVGAGTFSIPLDGTEFGFDFNPAVDRIRVVSDAGQNLRLNPNDGTVADGDAATAGVQPDAALAYAAGDPGVGLPFAVTAEAYTNNNSQPFPAGGTTTLFGLDTTRDVLVRQGGANGAPSPNGGLLTTIGSLGVDASAVAGLDIRAGDNAAIAALVVGGTPGLYSIDLGSGQASLVGAIGGGATLRGLALVPNGTLQFSSAIYSVVEGQAFATITVTRVGGTEGAVSVDYATGAGTATSGADYTDVGGTLTFADGDAAAKTFTIPILADAAIEPFPDETVLLTLSNPTGGAVLGAASTSTLQIVDDEPRTVSIDDTAARESDGKVTFTVSLNAPGGQTITVLVNTLAQTASAGADFTPIDGQSITFGPGVLTQTVVVTLADDSVFEPTEQFSVVLTGATNALIGKSQGTATILDVNAPVTVQGRTIAPAENASFSGVVASFDDPNGVFPVGTYSAVIDWGDGTATSDGTITQVNNYYVVAGQHTYADDGTYAIAVRVLKSGTTSNVGFGQAEVADAALVPQAVPALSTPEGAALANSQVATFVDLGGAEDPGSFVATIDWGDGSPISPGRVVASELAIVLTPEQVAAGLQSPGIFNVFATHIYTVPGTYLANVTIRSEGGRVATGGVRVDVAATPVFLTGALDPDSDSGSSSTDAVTNVRRPIFLGFSSPGAIVRYFAQASGGTAFQIGQVAADASGSYSLTSVPLPDGSYTILAQATSSSGGSTAAVSVFPAFGRSALVIDTIAPQVTDFAFSRADGLIGLAFGDDRVGLDRSTLIDGSNYRLTKPHTRLGAFRVTNLSASTPSATTDIQTVVLQYNRGRTLPQGTYTFTIVSGGIADLAGNALDGEYFGTFPSGNDRPGGDFVAAITAVGNRVGPPRPIGGFASPTTPGTRPGRTIDRPGRSNVSGSSRKLAASGANANAKGSGIAGRRVAFAPKQAARDRGSA